MADLWTLSTAIASLRTRLSDGATDKYVHQTKVAPTPDGVQTRFAVPDSHLTSSLVVYLDNEDVTAQLTTTDLAGGTFELDAPEKDSDLRASYYFQWFTDAELTDFLTEAAELLGFTGAEDAALPVGLRPAALSYGAYYAYMKKAALAADVVTTSQAGFSTDTSRQTPNWLSLAKMAWDNAEREKAAFATPLGAGKPAMRFVNMGLKRVVPRT